MLISFVSYFIDYSVNVAHKSVNQVDRWLIILVYTLLALTFISLSFRFLKKLEYTLLGDNQQQTKQQVIVTLVLFLLSVLIRIFMYILYIFVDQKFCKFANEHMTSFLFVTSLFYIMGEPTTICWIATVLLQSWLKGFKKRRQARKEKQKKANSAE